MNSFTINFVYNRRTLLASCEPEVKELMHQIELFLANKKKESDVKLQSCKSQIQQRDRELSLLRVAVQERQQQVGGCGYYGACPIFPGRSRG